ncbi:MAG TPA: hypothetical protein VMM16_14960 [Verrucomicrobiae bacterium]|nr:hypothetical protein [Verrucomicrobiae bacterium]
MSRRGFNAVAPILVALVLAMPLAARAVAGNNSKPTSTSMDVLTTVTLGGAQIKPGTYTVTADDSTVTLAQGSKVLAKASIQWKDEASKAKSSNIVTAGDRVTEIHFNGKMRYVSIAE